MVDGVVTVPHNLCVHVPPLQTLRAFEAAGRLQSYSRAGAELGLTHGAVSRRMRDLEALVGGRLFERQGNRMVPTRQGTRLLAQVRNVLGLLESIFPASSNKQQRTIVISLFPAFGRWLVPRLGPFRKSHPAINLKLELSAQVVKLGDGIDAALRYGSGTWPSTEARLLAREVLFPVCSPSYLAEHQMRDPADLLECALLRHPWHSWASWFQAAGVAAGEPQQGPEYSDSSMLVEAAIAGEGVALARGLGVADALRAGSLVRPFSCAIADARSYFFVRQQGQLDPALDEIEAWLAGELREAASFAGAEDGRRLAPPVSPS